MSRKQRKIKLLDAAALWQRRQDGEKYADIARDCDTTNRKVKRLVKRYDAKINPKPQPKYELRDTKKQRSRDKSFEARLKRM